MKIFERIAGAKARRDEIPQLLLEESAEFYLYDQMPPSKSKDQMAHSLWASTPEFRLYDALGNIIATYE